MIMDTFNIYFFKERSRQIDLDSLLNFFQNYEETEVEMDERSVRFKYQHPRLNYGACFYITPKSMVPNIYNLNPKYLEINFHIEIPILTPNYVIKQIIDFVKKVTERFDLFVYSELFSDVLPFKSDTVYKAYIIVKKAYLEKFPDKASQYIFVSTEKLSAILRYLDEQMQLQAYYKDLDTYVPRYLYFKENNRPVLCIEWTEGKLTVFPPYLDYVMYRTAGKLKVVEYDQFTQDNQKFLMDVPGFLKGTRVVPKKFAKKLYGYMKKQPLSSIGQSFNQLRLEELLD